MEPPPPSLQTKGATPSKVNIITGEYAEEEVDLVVAGIEPLSYRRFYNHLGAKDKTYGHWRINPECYMRFNFEKRQENLVAVGEENGTLLLYCPQTTCHYQLDSSKSSSFTAHGGQMHPLNTAITWKKSSPHLKYRYEGEILKGNGEKRLFASQAHTWKEVTGSLFQATIYEERKANGNLIRYTYTDCNPHSLGTYLLPSSITAYDSTGTHLLGSLQIQYRRKGKNGEFRIQSIHVTGSDGRTAFLEHTHRRVGSEKIKIHNMVHDLTYYDTVLDHVIAPGKPEQNYMYRWDRRKDYYNAPFLCAVSSDNFSEIHYDLGSKKVREERAPVGPRGEMHPTSRYEYHEDHTIVYDALSNKTLYRFNPHKRITSIERYQGEQLYSIEKITWEDATGNLLSKQLEDAQGKIFYLATYRYDKNHNVIEERVGDEGITRTYSQDGFNLLLTESDRPGKQLVYKYVPGTNLPLETATYDQGILSRKTTYFYDSHISSICIKTVTTGGDYQLIRESKPRRTPPCVGYPEEIIEKTGDQLLKRISYLYNSSGKLLQENHHDSNNQLAYTLYREYDTQERLIAVTDPLGNKTTYTYDRRGNLLSEKGPCGLYREWIYDPANRIIEEREGDLITKKRYDLASQLIAVVDPRGGETRYVYDALGRVIEIHHPDGTSETKQYDILGNVISERDGRGNTTQKTYNMRGEVTSITHPDGGQEQLTYQYGRLLSHKDPQGIITTYTYDIYDRELSRDKITYTYAPFYLLTEQDGEGHRREYRYDGAGRKVWEKKGDKETFYTYDPLGRVAQRKEETVFRHFYDLNDQLIEVSSDFEKREYAYDALGHQTHEITAKGVIETKYNAQGQPLWTRDPLGFITYYTYKNGLLTQEKNPQGRVKEYTYGVRGEEVERSTKNSKGETIQKVERRYDANQNLIEERHTLFEGIHPSGSLMREWRYDACNRLICLKEEDKETHYLYDLAGRLIKLTKPDGVEHHYTYDDLGRVKTYKGPDFHYQYTYDENDQIISVSDGTSRSYTPLGSLLKESLANGLTLTKSYDEHERCIQVTFPDKSFVEYTYQGPHLYEVHRKGVTHTYLRDLDGQIIQHTLPESLGSYCIARDALGRWKEATSAYYNSELTYDEGGHLIAQDRTHYLYDDLSQLIQDQEHTYAYDSLENRLTKDDKKLEERYDLNGNLLSDGELLLTYDSLDRLISAEKGRYKTLFTYDSFHRRLSKTLFEGKKEINKKLYFYEGENEIGVATERGKLEELRILGEGFGAEIGSATLIELKDKSYVPLHDHRGCVVRLIGLKDKKVAEELSYTGFGEERVKTQLSPWRFASKRVDVETGLVYFGKRYYHPHLGKWITKDPAGFEDGPNLHAYLHNSPLNDFDLYGLWSWRGAWDGAQDYGLRAFEYSRDIMYGMGSGLASAGEWMHADFQYEYFGDRSFFQEKSERALGEWQAFGRAMHDDPWGVIIPEGLMDVWNNPTSPGAWGKATVDVALLSFSVMKAGRAVSSIGKAGRVVGEAASTFGKMEVGVAESWRGPSNGFLGHNNWELKCPNYQNMSRNTPRKIGNLQYSSHALDQMQNRGLMPQIVENTVKTGRIFPTRSGTIGYYDPTNNVRVIVNSQNKQVITTILGSP